MQNYFGGNFFWLQPNYAQEKVLQYGQSYIWSTSLWSTKNIKKLIFEGSISVKKILKHTRSTGGIFFSS